MFNKLIAPCGLAVMLTIGALHPADAALLRSASGGDVRALVIGINEYPNLPPTARLSGADADATDISQALARVGVKALLLPDREATRTRVVAEIDRLLVASKPGDLVILTYAGHGMRVREYPQWKGIDASGANSQIVLSGYGRSGDAAHDIIVDKEMRAWLSRFDAKGVDVLVVMDSCFGGGMRDVNALSGKLAIRSIAGDAAADSHDSFTGIEMTQREARADVREMPHVTFLAGATASSVVPEMTGLDTRSMSTPRGALSYFVARALEGGAAKDQDVTREQLFKFLPQNVRQATNDRQRIDLEPRLGTPEALQKIIFRLSDEAPPQAVAAPADAVRVAVVNGSNASLSAIQKGVAPFVPVAQVDVADLVWDVRGNEAISRGDPLMSHVDGSVLGGVIDRTWAIRRIREISQTHVLPVRLNGDDKRYTVGDHPELVIEEIQDRYLTVFNIAADGTVQMLFPTGSNDPHMRDPSLTFVPDVAEPFGADHVVAVATSRPAGKLVEWLNAHDGKRDAASVPAVIADILAADPAARIGATGVYTTATR